MSNTEQDNTLIVCDACLAEIPFSQYQEHIQMHETQENPASNQHANVRMAFRFVFNDEELGNVRLTVPDLSHIFPQLGGQVDFAVLSFSIPEEINMENYEFNSLLTEMIGNVDVGFDTPEDAINNIKEEDINNIPNDEVCPICQVNILEIDHKSIVKTVSCQHIFCKECICSWLQRSKKCPVCMNEIKIEKEKIEST